MRTLLSLYVGIKQHSYREQDGSVHTDHTGGIQDAFWITGIIFAMFLLGGIL
jgi:hypothetical protein